jgi:hypothetical protein
LTLGNSPTEHFSNDREPRHSHFPVPEAAGTDAMDQRISASDIDCHFPKAGHRPGLCRLKSTID